MYFANYYFNWTVYAQHTMKPPKCTLIRITHRAADLQRNSMGQSTELMSLALTDIPESLQICLSKFLFTRIAY